MLKMTKREFMGHLHCSWRYSKLVWMIETLPIEEVLELQKFNEQLIRSPRYQDLKLEFQKRLQS
jgi:hypothetical protein